MKYFSILTLTETPDDEYIGSYPIEAEDLEQAKLIAYDAAYSELKGEELSYDDDNGECTIKILAVYKDYPEVLFIG